MIVNLISKHIFVKCKFINYDYKNKIFFYKPNKNLKEFFSFILAIKNENSKILYQVHFFQHDLIKFIKNGVDYYQYEKVIDKYSVIFRFNEKLYLKEIILK